MPISPITFTSPLADELIFESMNVTSGLSMLGEVHVTLLSENGQLVAEDLLGKPVDLKIQLAAEGSFRFINAYVARFGIGRQRGRHFGYQATLRPWLWFLTRTSDCRIFQELTVPDIVKKVFDDHGIARFELRLFRSYAPRIYCVQYRESDFNFVARLLEEEGIYWHFEHAEGEHKLILVDSFSSHDPVPDFEMLPYYDTEGQSPPATDYISNWSFTREVKSGVFAMRDFDFERPLALVDAQAVLTRKYDLSDKEVFDYPGLFLKSAVGQQLAENRLDEAHSGYQIARATSTAQGLTAGHTFELEKHPREDQNINYLLTHVDIQAQIDGNEGGSEHSGAYNCQIVAIPADQQFRPPRTTRKPFVQGPQTAIVTGEPGQEIDTDQYGRIKVRFHWDRLGKNDQTSSCWIRVAQIWAGKNFGGIHIPRIGQEVIVDFLEGDPDQPIITGRVYNGGQMPPWNLPEHKTQSGILSRSTLDGAYENANAIRFEDKKGSEQLWIHAEKNQDIEVENDETHLVGHDRKKTIDHDETTHVKHDRTETVDNNETITIGVDRTETVGSNETITIGSNRTETVGSNETISIGSNRSISVGGSETATVALQRTHAVGVNESIAIGAAQEIAIGAAQTVTVGAIQSISVGANQSTDVGANQSTKVGSNRSIDVDGDQTLKVGKGRSTTIGKDDTLKVGKNLLVEAADSVTIKTGDASITMKKDGTIVIKGKDIKIEGSGKINVKASSDVVIKGSKIGMN